MANEIVIKGKVAEYRFISEFIKAGYEVYLPTVEGTAVDMIIYKDEKYLRVQVKYTSVSNDATLCAGTSHNANDRCSRKKYSIDDCDIIAIYDANDEKGYLIPIKVCDNQYCITLRKLHAKNNNTIKVHKAEDYLFF